MHYFNGHGRDSKIKPKVNGKVTTAPITLQSEYLASKQLIKICHFWQRQYMQLTWLAEFGNTVAQYKEWNRENFSHQNFCHTAASADWNIPYLLDQTTFYSTVELCAATI